MKVRFEPMLKLSKKFQLKHNMQANQTNKVQISANLFRLTITKPIRLYTHKITITPELKRNFASELCLKIFDELEEIKAIHWAFDNANLFIADKKIDIETKIVVKETEYIFQLKQMDMISITPSTIFASESQLQALGLMIRSFQNRRYYSFLNRHVILQENTKNRNLLPYEIDGFISMAQGLLQTPKFLCGRTYLNVDTILTPFYSEMSLETIYRELKNISPTAFLNFVKKIKLCTTHLTRDFVFKAENVSHLAAHAIFFDFNGKNISVSEYFKLKNITLKYPNWPCIQKKRKNIIVSFPIELLKIALKQRVLKTLQDNQVRDIIKISAKPPAFRFEEILLKSKEMEILENSFLNEIGIEINSEFAKFDSEILLPPILRFSDKSNTKQVFVKPIKGEWNLLNTTAIIPVKHTTCTIIDGSSLSRILIDEKFKILKQGCENFNILLGTHRIVKVSDIYSELERHLEGFCIIILPQKQNKEFYKLTKCISEIHKQKSVTQCIKENTYKKMNITIASNIALKICIKSGGFSHFLNRGISLFNIPTMVLGIDVSHPGVGQNYGTLAAIVSTVDRNCVRYNTFMEFQPNREEQVLNLKDHLLSAFQKFKSINNTFPQSLIVFRDGVSTSQYETICKKEIESINTAFKELKISCKITYIVAQKRHSIRFCKTENTKSLESNVEPGTIVLHTNSNNREEFFMVSHRSPKGTARPVKYTVLLNENEYNELPKFIYELCHLYGRCTKSVSIVAPIYYAHLAATRAKVYRDNNETSIINGKEGLFYI